MKSGGLRALIQQQSNFVRLKRSTAYEPHRHKNSHSTIQITEGKGHIILRDGSFHPYEPGQVFVVPEDVDHGFFTLDETYFVSINNPAIATEGGRVDIEFAENRK